MQNQLCAQMRDPAAHPAPEGLDSNRIELYQSLVYGNIESFLAGGFPQVKARMQDKRWHRTVRDFIRSGRMQTPIFHELQGCFVLWLSEEVLGDSDLDRMLEQLAHFCWVRHALDFAPDEDGNKIDPEGDPLAGNPLWSSLAWPLRYDWRVHDVSPKRRVAREAVHLLAWRDHNDRVRWRECGPAVLLLAEAIRKAEGSLGGEQLLQQLAQALPDVDKQLVLAEGQQSLYWLKERGLIPGTAPATAARIDK